MDAAGVLVPLPDRRTVSVRRAEFDPLLGGRRKRAWGPSNGLMGPSAASHNRSGHQLNQRAVVRDEQSTAPSEWFSASRSARWAVDVKAR